MDQMASLEGHASKRQRTDNMDGFDRRMPDDGHYRPSASTVVHVRNISPLAVERDLITTAECFGTISYVHMMPNRRQALIEFEDIDSAINCVKHAEGRGLDVGGQQAYFNYSTSQKIQRPGGSENPENRVLLFTVLTPNYPITVDVIKTICSTHGDVRKIVIFKKHALQVMVEFDSIDSARRAKQSLNGADIYSGCCTLKIEYAKPTSLNVHKNDHESWDYTNPELAYAAPAPAAPKSAPLLADPRYTPRPTPYGEGQERMRHGVHGEEYDQYGRPIAADPYARPPTEQYPPAVSKDPYAQYYGAPPDRYMGPEGAMGPPNLGTLQQGSVLMAYGFNMDRTNCERVFNIFCLYGNVVRIKFLHSKEGSAMVQMGDNIACERAIQNLNGSFFFGNKLQLGYSKQAYITDVTKPYDLPDGSPSFQDFMGSRNNRFNTPEAAQKNRIQPPAKVLHYFNVPVSITLEDIRDIFEKAEVKPPEKIKCFPVKNESAKSATGLVEWDSKGEALEALFAANHTQVPNPTGKNPYTLKLCFSSTPIQE